MAASRGRVAPVLLIVALAIVIGACGRSSAPHRPPVPAVEAGGLFRGGVAMPSMPTPPPPPAPILAPDGVIAQATVAKISLYDDPESPAPATTMGNPTALGVPLVF